MASTNRHPGANAASTTRFRLLYSVRTPEDVFFAEELRALDAGNSNVAVDWVYTRETPPGWPTPAGRVSAESLKAVVIPLADDPTVFVCGPTGFVEAVADALVALGHPAGSVKTERFGGK